MNYKNSTFPLLFLGLFSSQLLNGRDTANDITGTVIVGSFSAGVAVTLFLCKKYNERQEENLHTSLHQEVSRLNSEVLTLKTTIKSMGSDLKRCEKEQEEKENEIENLHHLVQKKEIKIRELNEALSIFESVNQETKPPVKKRRIRDYFSKQRNE